MRISILNPVFPRHLKRVKATMRLMGPPTIRAVWAPSFGHWAALEGSHRVCAAKELGLRPIIKSVKYSRRKVRVGCDYLRVKDICDLSNEAHSIIIEF